jgi:hypothetical protein
MRVLLLFLASMLAVVGCNDARNEQREPEAPALLRKCGELDGVEPVAPLLLGKDRVGCPVFAPVPCTKPLAEYELVCGSDCGPRTATSVDGDAWFVGCTWQGPPDGCSGPDYELVWCSIDPFEGEEFWLTFRECQDPFVYYWDCWTTCDGEPLGDDCL